MVQHKLRAGNLNPDSVAQTEVFQISILHNTFQVTQLRSTTRSPRSRGAIKQGAEPTQWHSQAFWGTEWQ